MTNSEARKRQQEREAAYPFGYAVSATHHDPIAPGTLVLAWPVSRMGSPLVTRTRGECWSLGDGTRVVAVEGHAGGISLAHVDVLPANVIEAAKNELIVQLSSEVVSLRGQLQYHGGSAARRLCEPAVPGWNPEMGDQS